MPTEWTYPNTVTQYAESDVHVPWLNVGENFDEIKKKIYDKKDEIEDKILSLERKIDLMIY